ncbi:MAG: GntR family transcriptional regulator [Victivallaceae bacterium]|nr:GntR family transcriptional regulator [Victivallaceae bacterium]
MDAGLNKTDALVKAILEDLSGGALRYGGRLPSRNVLARKYKCSRTTVERAVAALTRAGYLSGRKGSCTTILRPGARPAAGRIVFVGNGLPALCELELLLLAGRETSTLSIVRITERQIFGRLEELCEPGCCVIWMLPREEMLSAMDYLRLRNVPQLIINRQYASFDYVLTDTHSGLQEGLRWLTERGGRPITFLSYRADPRYPYLAERIISFFERGIHQDYQLTPEYCFLREFENPAVEIAALGESIFGDAKAPKSIFVMNLNLLDPLLDAAERYGRIAGRDYWLFSFDAVPRIAGRAGFGMLRQRFDLQIGEARRWLESGCAFSGKPFHAVVKADFTGN